MKVKLYNGKEEELYIIDKEHFDKMMKLPKEDLIYIIDSEILMKRLSEKISGLLQNPEER